MDCKRLNAPPTNSDARPGELIPEVKIPNNNEWASSADGWHLRKNKHGGILPKNPGMLSFATANCGFVSNPGACYELFRHFPIKGAGLRSSALPLGATVAPQLASKV